MSITATLSATTGPAGTAGALAQKNGHRHSRPSFDAALSQAGGGVAQAANRATGKAMGAASALSGGVSGMLLGLQGTGPGGVAGGGAPAGIAEAGEAAAAASG